MNTRGALKKLFLFNQSMPCPVRKKVMSLRDNLNTLHMKSLDAFKQFCCSFQECFWFWRFTAFATENVMAIQFSAR